MSVRVNKSSFSIREKLSELERPIGLKGSELMRSETVQDARDLVSAGRKNLIINGDFKIWQRGTTVTAAGYTADRFMAYSTNTNVANYGVKVTQQQDSPIGVNGYCAEIALSNTSGGIDKVTFGQRIEAINFYGLKSGTIMTLSFYLKRIQNANSDLTLYIKSAQNGVDSYTNSAVNQNSYDITVKSESLGSFNTIPTIWTKYSFTFAVTDALITNGGSFYIQNGNADLGVTNTNALYRTTGWQLEVGKNATEFEHRSYGEELALCQRYYVKYYPSEQEWVYVETGSTMGHRWWYCPIPPGMRAQPSTQFNGTWTGSIFGGNSITSIGASSTKNGGGAGYGRMSARVYTDNTDYTSNTIVHTDAWSGGTTYVSFTSEL